MPFEENGTLRPSPREESDWKKEAKGTRPWCPLTRSLSEAKRSRVKWSTESSARKRAGATL